MKHQPRAQVENHHHIQELIERQEKRSEDRIKHQEQEKARDNFIKGVSEFKDIEALDFHCERCHIDFAARTKKQIDSWAEIAYYKTKHPCGTWCIRLITQRDKDPYFYRSRAIARQRGEHHNDLLQEFETGYNMLYTKK